MEPYVFVAQRAVPALGIVPGDVLIVEPGAERPVVVERPLPPNYGLILGAAESGALTSLTPHQPLAALAQAVGQHPPPVSGGWRRPRARHLHRLK